MVFFIDVDNTLLNNDVLKQKINLALVSILGKTEARDFWEHYKTVRKNVGLVDFYKTITDYCTRHHKSSCNAKLAAIFSNIDFSACTYNNVKDVILHLKKLGKVALFTEGDSVYQKQKVEKSGLVDLVDEVFLFEHKLDHLDEVMTWAKKVKALSKEDENLGNGAVFIDDKAQNLVKISKKYPKVKTIEVLQGHYGNEDHVEHERVDVQVEGIANLRTIAA